MASPSPAAISLPAPFHAVGLFVLTAELPKHAWASTPSALLFPSLEKSVAYCSAASVSRLWLKVLSLQPARLPRSRGSHPASYCSSRLCRLAGLRAVPSTLPALKAQQTRRKCQFQYLTLNESAPRLCWYPFSIEGVGV